MIMKKILAISFIALISIYSADAQKNKKNETQTTNPDVQEFTVEGIQVILKSSANDVVSARLFIKGGTVNYDKAHEGVEAFSLALAAVGGTANYPKDVFHTALESMGSSIGYATNYDYSQLTMKCVHQKWNETWKIFADVISNPSMDPEEFEKLKEQMIATALDVESDPDNMLRRMSIMTTFAGTNYEKVPDGTAASLETLTLDDVKTHLNKISEKAKMVLVIVGKIDKADVEDKVKSSLAKLPQGSYTKVTAKELYIPNSKVDYAEREIATNYMRGLFSAPLQGTKEATAMRVAMSIVNDRLFIEIRTKRNLSYAPGANMSALATPYCILYVSTTDPNQSADVMMTELAKIRKIGFSEKELTDIKSMYLTEYYMRNETNDAQSLLLGESEIISGDWSVADNLVNDVYSLSLNDINSVVRKYADKIKWTYIGDKSIVDEKIFTRPVSTIKIEGEDTQNLEEKAR